MLEPGLPGEAEFYTRLALAAQPPVLELGTGTGRIALAFARAGVAAVGLDFSAAMLRVAHRNSAGLYRIGWLQADMRSFTLACRFGLICIPFRGFQHLLTEDDQRATLTRCHEHLLPGGLLAINIFNPPDRLHRTTPLRENRERLSRIDRERPQRFVRPDEMRALLIDSGFRVESLFGWFDGQAFGEASSEQVWIARAS